MPNTVATFTYDIAGYTGDNPASPQTRALFDAYQSDGRIINFDRSRDGTIETMSILFKDSESMDNYVIEVNQNPIFEIETNIDAAYTKAREDDLTFFEQVKHSD